MNVKAATAQTRIRRRQGFLSLGLIALCFVLIGCSSTDVPRSLINIAKSDIDLVADRHRYESTQLVQRLMEKLYRRNPVQFPSGMTLEKRQAQFEAWKFDRVSLLALEGKRGIDAIRMAFEPRFEGDRVFALTLGLRQMLDEAYGNQEEFFVLDSLDQQKLYHSARNIEVVGWLLRSRVDAHGRPLLLSNEFSMQQVNLSFERLLGKLISVQDMMALIISDKTQRAINLVAHSVMSMTLIPL